MSLRLIRNQKGVLTVDFLFALLITLGLTTVLFVLSFALSMFEVIQYVAFSASRSFYAGQISIEAQKKAGTDKFNELISQSALKPLVKSDWFELKLLLVGASTNPLQDSSIQSRYTDNPRIQSALVGSLVNVHAKFIDFQLPLLGSTTGEDGGGFKTRITSFVGREPTQVECMDVVKQRWLKILELTAAGGSVSKNDKAYVPLDDNGC